MIASGPTEILTLQLPAPSRTELAQYRLIGLVVIYIDDEFVAALASRPILGDWTPRIDVLRSEWRSFRVLAGTIDQRGVFKGSLLCSSVREI